MGKTTDLDAALSAEARRRGITLAELLREKTPKMTPIHTRLSSDLLEEIDADAERRKTTRAEVIRERLERGPVPAPMKRVTNVRG
jgi:hypothetical protein